MILAGVLIVAGLSWALVALGRQLRGRRRANEALGDPWGIHALGSLYGRRGPP